MVLRMGVRKKQWESWINTCQKFLRLVAGDIVSLYLLLMIVILPFYNEEGYSHIGTDKALFFRTWSVRGAKAVLPVAGLYLIVSAAGRALACSEGLHKPGTVKKAMAAARAFCKRRFCLMDIFALLYGTSCLLSYWASEYKGTALWGTSGWYMGLIPQLTLIAIYFLTAHCRGRKKGMFYLFFPVSAVVFVLGILNRFGIYPLEMEGANPSFISTIGNINWYCGYVVAVFFMGVGLFWLGEGEKLWQKLLLAGYVATGFMTLLTNGSSSGILALAVVLLTMFFMSVDHSGRNGKFWLILLILSMVCAIIRKIREIFPGQMTREELPVEFFADAGTVAVMFSVSVLFLWIVWRANKKGQYPQRFFAVLARRTKIILPVLLLLYVGMLMVNTNVPGSLGCLSELPLFTFNDSWGSNRGATWGIGWQCFAEQDLLHKIVGVGPDCMADFLYQDGSAELVSWVRRVFGDARLTNAHNEWLTVLVNTGVLGCINYVGMLVSAALHLLKQRQSSEKGMEIAAACGLCVMAYMANSMFSFQQTMGVVTLFMVMGMGRAWDMQSIKDPGRV